MTQKDYRFTRKQVREFTSWSDQQLQVHLNKLVSLEYLLPHRGGRGQSFVYELLYDGDAGSNAPRLVGLAGTGINGLTHRFFGEKEPTNDPSLGHLCPILGDAALPGNGSGGVPTDNGDANMPKTLIRVSQKSGVIVPGASKKVGAAS